MQLKLWLLSLLRLALTVLPALPALAVLAAILHTSALPDLDYWYSLGRFTDDDGLALNLRFLTLHSNEHLIPFAGLLYVLNILLTNGSNIGLSLIAWTMGLLQLLVLAALLPEQCKLSPLAKRLWWLVISLFIFTPVAHHNWLRGMSGVCWITANAMSMLALFFLVKVNERFSWSRILACAACGVAAATSYSTGLMVWPILGVGALVIALGSEPREWRPLAALTATVIPIIALVVSTAERPAHHAAPKIALSAAQHGEFIISLLGGSFDSSAVGAAGLIVAAILVGLALVLVMRGRVVRAWPWLLLLSYPIANAFVSAIFRSDAFKNAASASRYGSLPSIFILALLVSAAALLPPTSRKLVSCLALLGVILGTSPFFSMRPEIEREFRHQDRKQLAQLSLELGVPDSELLRRTTMRETERFELLLPRLKKMEHVPYSSRDNACSPIGRHSTLVASEDQSMHQVSTVRSVAITGLSNAPSPSHRPPTGTRISGNITPALRRAPPCVVVLNSEDTVVGHVIFTRQSESKTSPGYGIFSSLTSWSLNSRSLTLWSGYLVDHNFTTPLRFAIPMVTRQDSLTAAQVMSDPFVVPLIK